MKPISNTAWYCCGVRMQDAESENPLIGDRYARRLLGEEGMKYWSEFISFKRPNTGNAVRHYIIDQLLARELGEHPDANIILIGAGLDSRAYRFGSGTWIEVDEPPLISYKNDVLPVSECANRLVRIPIDFSREALSDKLRPHAQGETVIFVIEGVLMYLTREQKHALLNTMTSLFPRHTVFCDLMQRRFFEKLARPIHEKLASHGAPFSDITDDPAAVFRAHGYRQETAVSILDRTADLGRAGMPTFLFRMFLGPVRKGYCIHTFAFPGDSAAPASTAARASDAVVP